MTQTAWEQYRRPRKSLGQQGLGDWTYKIQVPNISGFWSQIPYLSWILEPETSSIGCLDPLGDLPMGIRKADLAVQTSTVHMLQAQIGVLLWGPYNKDPIVLGSILGILVVYCIVHGSFHKLGILFWGPYMRDPIVLGPYQVPLILVLLGATWDLFESFQKIRSPNLEPK